MDDVTKKRIRKIHIAMLISVCVCLVAIIFLFRGFGTERAYVITNIIAWTGFGVFVALIIVKWLILAVIPEEFED